MSIQKTKVERDSMGGLLQDELREVSGHWYDDADMSQVRKIASDMNERGYDSERPVIVCQHAETLINGRHRVLAADMACLDSIDAISINWLLVDELDSAYGEPENWYEHVVKFALDGKVDPKGILESV
jgi:hypothetical protein